MNFEEYKDEIQKAVVARDRAKLKQLVADAVNTVVSEMFKATDKANITKDTNTLGVELGSRAAGWMTRYGVPEKTPVPVKKIAPGTEGNGAV